MDKKKIEIIAVVLLIATFIFTLSGSLKKVGSKFKAKSEVVSAAINAPQAAAQASQASKKKMKPDIKEEIYAAGDRDPFGLPDSPQAAGGISTLKLTGISTNGAGKMIAVINEEIVPAGGKIGNFTVVNITSKKVILTDGQKTTELKLAE